MSRYLSLKPSGVEQWAFDETQRALSICMMNTYRMWFKVQNTWSRFWFTSIIEEKIDFYHLSCRNLSNIWCVYRIFCHPQLDISFVFKRQVIKVNRLFVGRLNEQLLIWTIYVSTSLFYHTDKDLNHDPYCNWNWTKWSNPVRSSSLETHVTSGRVDSLPSNGEAKISSVPCLNKCTGLINFPPTPSRSSRPSLQRSSGTYNAGFGGGGVSRRKGGKEETSCNGETSEPLLSCRNPAWKIPWFHCMSNLLAISGNSLQC